MPMHIPSKIETDWSDTATLSLKLGTLLTPTSPASRGDIPGIFQREQEHAMFLLSLSPLLSSLFVTYANRAASLESTSASSSENGGWKMLRDSITALREENEKLQTENREMVSKLEVAQASQEGLRSHISSLGEINAAHQNEVNSLQKELVESKDLYERVMKDWNVEKTAYQTRISDIEGELVELKQNVADKLAKISILERQLPGDGPPPRPIRHTPPQAQPRSSLTSSEVTATPRARTIPLEGGEEEFRLSSASTLTRELDVQTHFERAWPQPSPRGPLPPSKPRSQSHPQKSSRGGWLRALNDSF